VLSTRLRILYFFSLLCFVAPATAADPASETPSYKRGEGIFKNRCAPCHTIGGGKKIGPDLSGVTERRKRDWLVRWLDNPGVMIASGDETAKKIAKEYSIVMPPPNLTKNEILEVVEYLESHKMGGGLPARAELQKERKGEVSFSTRTYLQFFQDARGNRYQPLYERVDLEVQERERKWSFRSSGLLRYDLRTPASDKREMDELTYAFLTYTPSPGRGPVFKIGRYYVFDGVAADQVDGVHFSWEIVPSTGLSVFGGRPVEAEFDGKRGDYVYGGRLYQRVQNKAEVGVSFLKEDNNDRRFREEFGLDIWLLPLKNIELQGHSYWNNMTEGWMEHFYTLRIPLQKVVITGQFGQTDYRDAFSASTLSAFSPDLLGRDEGLTKIGGSVEYRFSRDISAIANYMNYGYKKSGDARYYGGSVNAGARGLSAGLSVHRMDGDIERLRYLEFRAYIKKDVHRVTFVLDALDLHYDQPMSGLRDAYSVSGTALYRITNALSVGADIDYRKNPDFSLNTLALLKLLYTFRKDL